METYAVNQRELPMERADATRIAWVDGLRGFAALWVLLSHVQILSGLRSIPVLSWGSLAVDLFMLLSGLLMAHNYLLRESKEPWSKGSTVVAFWVRRFFRIAPIYYLLLIIALVVAPQLGSFREAIGQVWPATGTPGRRYGDSSALNLLLHASFVFGALPDYAFRTPLPDWSIGLEMQFYVAFPFLMLMMRRFGPYLVGVLSALACVAIVALLPEFFGRFEMPSFLPMKLYVFMAGMWIGFGRKARSMGPGLLASLLLMGVVALNEGTVESVARVAMVVAMYYLMNDGSLPSGAFVNAQVQRVRKLFMSGVGRFLGDISYCVYLLHLLILLPVTGLLARSSAYVALPAPLRFALVLGISLPCVSALSWLLYRTIETHGIELGRTVVSHIRRSPGTVASS